MIFFVKGQKGRPFVAGLSIMLDVKKKAEQGK